MQIIDGKKTASDIREELKNEISSLIKNGKKVPGLVTILVGEDPASQIYVKSKGRACEEIGMLSKTEILPDDISEEKLLDLVDHYNNSQNLLNRQDILFRSNDPVNPIYI